MNPHLLDPALFANPAEWPRCPQCATRDVLVANRRQYCLNCSNRSPIGQGQGQLRGRIAPFVLAASLVQGAGLAGPAVQFGPFPQSTDPEFGHILHARRVEAVLDEVLDPLVEKAAAYRARHGAFTRTGLRFPTLFARPEAVELGDAEMEEVIETGRRHARGADAYADLFLAHETDGTPPPFLMVHFECYGAPPILRGSSLSASEPTDTIRQRGVHDFLYQPLYWPAYLIDPAHETLHYAAGLEARGSSNACLAVTESLDSGEILLRKVLRAPGDPAPRSDRTKRFDSTEEAVAAARTEYRRLTNLIEAEAQVFSFEREFGLERNFLSIVGELEQLEIWEGYNNERSK